MPNDGITAAELARRYSITLVKAHRWLRELPHWNVGRARFTSEPMLAGWLAANVKNPPRVKNFDPLQDAVLNAAIELIQRLVEAGQLSLVDSFTRINANDRQFETFAEIRGNSRKESIPEAAPTP